MKTDELMVLSDFFKCFSDFTRLRILSILLRSPANVSQITEELEISQSLVSHQLKHLKDYKFVKSEKIGKTHVYSIADDHIKIILEYAIEHIREDELYEKD